MIKHYDEKLYIFCLLVLFGMAAMAQDFEIVSVEYLKLSMQAVENKVTEQGNIIGRQG